MNSILEPYFRYVSLKAQRQNQNLADANIPSVQVHSYFGLRNIPGFDKVFLKTEKTIKQKYDGHRPKPGTIPTAAKEYVDPLESGKKLLSSIALLCITPSTPLEISERVNYHVDEVRPILIALKNKKVVKEQNNHFTLSIVGDHPPSGSQVLQQAIKTAALLGWAETSAREEDVDDISYASIVENIRPKGRKSVKNILVLDLLRAPNADPEQKQVQTGQLSFLFEDVYSSPLEEACLFATLSMPRTCETLRDETCSTPVSNVLRGIWGKAKQFGFIDNELRTTPYGERVISTLAGTPLAPFRHIKSLLDYCSEPISFKLPENYRTEFMEVVYSGVLYSVLEDGCGLNRATQIMQNKSRVGFFLSALGTPDFYLPQKIANKLEIDETSAKNAFAQAFTYGACGISTTSHPDLYKPTKKVKET